jgi:hypothetical protein
MQTFTTLRMLVFLGCLTAAWAAAADERPRAVGEPAGVENPTLRLPERPADAVTGSQFLKQIEALSREGREAAILREISSGNLPGFLRTLKRIDAEAADAQGGTHTGAYFVTSDVLAVGSDDDFFRAPMTPMTAQAIADVAAASLITTKISDEIFRQAELKLEPRPLTKDRDATLTFYQHHQIVEAQRGESPIGRLIAGMKKDVVLSNRLREKPRRVAIYGWHYPDRKPIQPLYVGHVDWHVDYSHGIRLMSRRMIVDGRTMDVRDVMKDEKRCVLVSNEGPIDVEYPR